MYCLMVCLCVLCSFYVVVVAFSFELMCVLLLMCLPVCCWCVCVLLLPSFFVIVNSAVWCPALVPSPLSCCACLCLRGGLGKKR